MGIRVFIFLFGFGITTIGLLYVISCLNALWGFLCIVLTLYWKRGDKSELYI